MIFFGVPVVAVILVVSDVLVIQVVVTATVVRVIWGGFWGCGLQPVKGSLNQLCSRLGSLRERVGGVRNRPRQSSVLTTHKLSGVGLIMDSVPRRTRLRPVFCTGIAAQACPVDSCTLQSCGSGWCRRLIRRLSPSCLANGVSAG